MSAVTNLPRFRLSVDRYHQMIERGILTKEDRCELIRGELVAMTPIGPKHQAVVDRLTRVFVEGVQEPIARVQGPLELEDSEVYPDLMVLEPRKDNYASANPTPTDVMLLVEVSDSTLQADLETKIPLYAQSGIAEVWLVDIPNIQVRRYKNPKGERYTEEAAYTEGVLQPTALPEIHLLLSDLWHDLS